MTGPRHASVGSKHPFHARRAQPTPGLGPSRGASQGRSLPTLELRRGPRSFPRVQSQLPSATSHPRPGAQPDLPQPLSDNRSPRPALPAGCRTVATHTCRSCARALHAGWSWPPGPEATAPDETSGSARSTRTRRIRRYAPPLSSALASKSTSAHVRSLWLPCEMTVEVSRG